MVSAIGVAALFLAAGCSKSSDTAATGTTAAPSTSAATTASPAATGSPSGTAAAGAASIKLASTPKGMVIVDDKGNSLYLYTKDTGPTSTCTGGCATAWPPATVTGTPTAGTGLDQSKVSTTKASDGSTMIVYNGHPLYRFAQDMSPGQTNGEGIGSVWYLVNAQGSQV
jgi:predicted lipoprotein with Yx(FWY)xxD motif